MNNPVRRAPPEKLEAATRREDSWPDARQPQTVNAHPTHAEQECVVPMARPANRHFDVPPLDLLLAFEAAARHLSFTRAGAELFLTQSAVSRQIQALEEALGVRLFERRTRALLLTERGRTLLATTQDVLKRLHDTVQRVRGRTDAQRLNVTTTPGFAALWLIPRLARFAQQHPGVDVRISATNEMIDLAHAEVDLAIRYAPSERVPGATLLFGEEVYPVCSPALLKSGAPLVAPADLRHHTLLHLDDARAAWMDWSVWLHAMGLDDLVPGGTLRFSQYDQVMQAALAGQGVALGRSPLIRAHVREGKLVAPFRKALVSSRAYYLVEAPYVRRAPEVAAFKAWLIDEAARDAALPVLTGKRPRCRR
jgi:LysR family glycine cleavage system transcriptional activator